MAKPKKLNTTLAAKHDPDYDEDEVVSEEDQAPEDDNYQMGQIQVKGAGDEDDEDEEKQQLETSAASLKKKKEDEDDEDLSDVWIEDADLNMEFNDDFADYDDYDPDNDSSYYGD